MYHVLYTYNRQNVNKILHLKKVIHTHTHTTRGALLSTQRRKAELKVKGVWLVRGPQGGVWVPEHLEIMAGNPRKLGATEGRAPGLSTNSPQSLVTQVGDT